MKPSRKRKQNRLPKRHHARKRPNAAIASPNYSSDEEYRVGPGRPPREYQFKPGQSGNPKGAKPKAKSPVPDLKILLERALNKKMKRGERDMVITKLNAGCNKLADQFADGDHRARRDVFDYAKILGIDFTARQGKARAADVITEAEIRQALLDREIPARLLPPIDEAGLEPPPDPPLPSDDEDEPEQ